MADLVGNINSKIYFEDIPQRRSQFDLKGLDNIEWGMKDRLSKIFNPKDNRSLMLAFDHGYFMGSTRGLERVDISIQDIAQHVDALMGTRGAFRTSISPTNNKGVALRVSSGSTMASEDITKEIVAVDIEDAIRLNASIMAVQTFIGTDEERSSLKNLSDVINAGNRYAIPTMGVVAVGKTMERTSRFFLLATRVVAELGAHVIKTYYCDDFEKVVAACPVPIVVAGGKKLDEKEALELAYKSIQSGASGVDMGRNIFQSDSPEAMIQAVAKVVHENFKPDMAFELYQDIKNELNK